MPDVPANTVTIDVREDIREGREPLRRIMEVVSSLRDGESLRLLAPFEPRPLISMLATQGFTAEVHGIADGFEVIFTPDSDPNGDELL